MPMILYCIKIPQGCKILTHATVYCVLYSLLQAAYMTVYYAYYGPSAPCSCALGSVVRTCCSQKTLFRKSGIMEKMRLSTPSKRTGKLIGTRKYKQLSVCVLRLKNRRATVNLASISEQTAAGSTGRGGSANGGRSKKHMSYRRLPSTILEDAASTESTAADSKPNASAASASVEATRARGSGGKKSTNRRRSSNYMSLYSH